MKCAICKNKTTWDTSFGKSSYLVCGKCFEKMRKNRNAVEVLDEILKIGEEIEKTLDINSKSVIL